MRPPSLIAVALLLVASSDAIAGSKFVASEAKGKKIPAQVVIRNDRKTISASRFDGRIHEALVSLRTTPLRLDYKPFGAVIYASRSAISSQRVPSDLAPIFKEAAEKHGVDPRLLVAVARRESAFNTRATSSVGAQGLMQLMPATATFLGITDSFSARENVFAGTRYLRMLLDTFGGDLDLSLAAYNAGPGAVRRHRGVPPYRETQSYVKAIRAEYEKAIK